jgi:GR25 family glycosyltransferase involved in LPS biosynthesis
VLEDDVTFHTHFLKLFPRYAAEVRGRAAPRGWLS